MNLNFIMLAEANKNIMIKDWQTISKNTIEALKIMGMGLVAIFLVIAIIIIAVYILNAVDKKIVSKKMAKASETPVAISEDKKAIPLQTTPNKVERISAVNPVKPVNQVQNDEDEALKKSELGESKYRKIGNVDKDSYYRKNDDNE